MTTRRAFLALLLAPALAAPGAGAAPPAPQLRDVTGDWVLEGQDIVWARVSDVLVGGVPHLRAELKLVAPPLADAQNHYFVEFVHRCSTLQFHAYVGHLDPEPVTAQFERKPYCYTLDEDPEPNASYPVTVTLRGSTMTWAAPYADGMKRGSVLSRFTASAFSVTDGVVYDPGDSPEGIPDPRPLHLEEGDKASAPEAIHVVGSDLPRR
ncbi:MAG TPA: hypothetical protein VNQ77_17345 [Frankiaceae bacterium]|nr:hypothetical protein [Frankiaceae bacterium]